MHETIIFNNFLMLYMFVVTVLFLTTKETRHAELPSARQNINNKSVFLFSLCVGFLSSICVLVPVFPCFCLPLFCLSVRFPVFPVFTSCFILAVTFCISSVGDTQCYVTPDGHIKGALFCIRWRT